MRDQIRSTCNSLLRIEQPSASANRPGCQQPSGSVLFTGVRALICRWVSSSSSRALVPPCRCGPLSAAASRSRTSSSRRMTGTALCSSRAYSPVASSSARRPQRTALFRATSRARPGAHRSPKAQATATTPQPHSPTATTAQPPAPLLNHHCRHYSGLVLQGWRSNGVLRSVACDSTVPDLVAQVMRLRADERLRVLKVPLLPCMVSMFPILLLGTDFKQTTGN